MQDLQTPPIHIAESVANEPFHTTESDNSKSRSKVAVEQRADHLKRLLSPQLSPSFTMICIVYAILAWVILVVVVVLAVVEVVLDYLEQHPGQSVLFFVERGEVQLYLVIED